MKVYLESKAAPWITWDKDLWKEAQTSKSTGIEITSLINDADVRVFELEPMETYDFDCELVAFYIPSISDKGISQLFNSVSQHRDKVIFLTDSIDVMERLKDNFPKFPGVYRWNPPTRVQKNLILSGDYEIVQKNGGFTITCNGSRTKDNLAEVLRTYFAMCLKDQSDGTIELMEDLNIFSAQELPFEVFNNVYFHGLQPNPKMFKTIKGSKLFISPYNGDGVPLAAIDAIMLGTPILVRDTPVNRSIFNWNDKCFYRDEKELAQKLKFFSDTSTNADEYVRMVNDGFGAVKNTHSVNISLNNLVHILKGI